MTRTVGEIKGLVDKLVASTQRQEQIGDALAKRQLVFADQAQTYQRQIDQLTATVQTALRQVEGLGFSRDDVRHIVLTHCDLDHSGGIVDFPKATVHVHALEKEAVVHPKTRIERTRYAKAHFAHGPNWAVYQAKGEPWFGFECVRDLDRLPPEILLIPLHGHTRGHSGVAVQSKSGWLLHAGDAYFCLLYTSPSPRD